MYLKNARWPWTLNDLAARNGNDGRTPAALPAHLIWVGWIAARSVFIILLGDHALGAGIERWREISSFSHVRFPTQRLTLISRSAGVCARVSYFTRRVWKIIRRGWCRDWGFSTSDKQENQNKISHDLIITWSPIEKHCVIGDLCGNC
jgi:hypothetical protein